MNYFIFCLWLVLALMGLVMACVRFTPQPDASGVVGSVWEGWAHLSFTSIFLFNAYFAFKAIRRERLIKAHSRQIAKYAADEVDRMNYLEYQVGAGTYSGGELRGEEVRMFHIHRVPLSVQETYLVFSNGRLVHYGADDDQDGHEWPSVVAVVVSTAEIAGKDDVGVRFIRQTQRGLPGVHFKMRGTPKDGDNSPYRRVVAHTWPNGKPGSVGVGLTEGELAYVKASGVTDGVLPAGL